MLGIIATIFILICALIGVPLFIVLGIASLVCFSLFQIELSSIGIEMFRVASTPSLASIPLFTLAGYMLAESHSPRRIIRLAKALCGHFPGGIAIVSLVVCAFFTAFTGASGVTIIALGALLYPVLREQNYSDMFSLGLLTTCGSLGLLFPPSLPLILYGVIAKVDIADLFKAGIVPGTVIMIVYALWAIKKGEKKDVEPFSWAEVRAALRGGIWEVALPVVIAVGIYGGYATVSEMSTLTVLYVFIVEFVVFRDLHVKKDLTRIIIDSMYLVGAILMILCLALGFTNFLVDQEIPLKVLVVMKQVFHNRYSLLLFFNVFLLVIGAMKDVFSAIIVVVPLILPIAKEYDIHPVHMGIIFLTNLEIGYIAPPFGINLFIASARFKRPIADVYRATWPFLVLSFLALMIVTYVPFLSLMWIKQ